jgi:hypothetical protein
VIGIFSFCVTLWALYYFVASNTNRDFLDSAMANLFATILGVGVGFPVALAINRQQQIFQDAIELKRSAREAVKLKSRVLRLIQKEIWEIKHQVKIRQSGGNRIVPLIPLPDILWTAFLSGGELRHIHQPELLAQIAQVYSATTSVNSIEKRYLDSVSLPMSYPTGIKTLPEQLLEALVESDEQLLENLDGAIIGIVSEIGPIIVNNGKTE